MFNELINDQIEWYDDAPLGEPVDGEFLQAEPYPAFVMEDYVGEQTFAQAVAAMSYEDLNVDGRESIGVALWDIDEGSDEDAERKGESNDEFGSENWQRFPGAEDSPVRPQRHRGRADHQAPPPSFPSNNESHDPDEDDDELSPLEDDAYLLNDSDDEPFSPSPTGGKDNLTVAQMLANIQGMRDTGRELDNILQGAWANLQNTMGEAQELLRARRRVRFADEEEEKEYEEEYQEDYGDEEVDGEYVEEDTAETSKAENQAAAQGKYSHSPA